MILWVDGAHDPAENMRRDARLLAHAERGGEAVLRLFRFAPAGITLGMSQAPKRELDLERCRADGIPWAVRPTGGRAIFHAEEWTFALAAAIGDPRWGGDAAASYDRLGEAIVSSFRRLGIPAARTRGRLRRSEHPAWAPRAAGPTSPCFASTGRHEIVLEGRKLAGTAQRRTRAGMLQQGSVLLGPGHMRLADYLALPEPARAAVRRTLGVATRDAGEWVAADAPLDLWADALVPDLPPGTRRLEAAAGAFLLTLGEAGSYTSPVPQAEG